MIERSMKLFFTIFPILLLGSGFIYAKSSGSCHDCDCSATSHTFFSVRPPFQLNSPESRSVFRNFMDAKVDGYHGAFQLVGFGGSMTQNDRMAKYFLPDCKQTLRINELVNPITTAVSSQQIADMYAPQLGIVTQDGTFESRITFEPEQHFAGIGFTWQQAIYEQCDGREIWIRVLFPVERVRNRIDLCETVINPGGGVRQDVTAIEQVQPNATAAFQQEAWRFGKVPVCTQTETGVADVTILIGYESVENPCSFLHTYIGGIIPTGNKPDACFLWEPMVGHNGHGAFAFGSTMGMVMWENECLDRKLDFALDVAGVYYFEGTERRFADLKNKPFSRYMYVFANQTDAANNKLTPGINLFTQDFNVKPGFERIINSAMIYNSCWGIEGEVGYNFFARQEECIELKCTLPSNIALANVIRAFNPTIPDEIGATDSIQLISNPFNGIGSLDLEPDDPTLGSYTNNILSTADIDLESVTHPCMIEHTFYASLAYKGDMWYYPGFVGLGGSYKLSRGNTGMHAWMIWGKVGLAY